MYTGICGIKILGAECKFYIPFSSRNREEFKEKFSMLIQMFDLGNNLPDKQCVHNVWREL